MPEKEEILDRLDNFWAIGESGNKAFMDRMAKNIRYKAGKQWDPEVVENNTRKKKFSLTIPIIRPQIMQLVGQIVQNPRDITVLNHHGGMKQLADLQTALVKHALSDESCKYELAHWFEQGVSAASGQLGIFINRARDPMFGDLELRQLDWRDVIWDPTCRVYDPNTHGEGAKFVFYRPWIDNDYLRAQWPEYADEIVPSSGDYKAKTGRVGAWMDKALRLFGVGGEGLAESEGEVAPEDYSDLKTRITHCWWINPTEVWYAYDMRQDDPKPELIIDKAQKAKLEKAAKLYKDVFEIKSVVIPVINHTIRCDDIILEHSVDELNMQTGGTGLFPIIGFYPYFDSGYKATITDDLIGTQDLVNHTRSQSLNILSNQANTGWIVKSDLVNKGSWLQDHGNENGVVINSSQFGGAVERLNAVPFPAAMEAMVQSAKLEAREITSIRAEAPEADKKNMSGYAIALKQAASAIGTSGILGNYDHSLHIFGTVLVTAIRSTRVYSDWEIKLIIEEKGLLDPKMLNECRFLAAQSMGQKLPIMPTVRPEELALMQHEEQQAEIAKLEQLKQSTDAAMAKLDAVAKPMAIKALITMLRDPQAGRYYAAIGTTPSSPTARIQQRAEMMDLSETLQKSGLPPLPADVIVEAWDISGKEKILARMGATSAV